VKPLIALFLCVICVSKSAAAKTFVLVHGAFEDGSVWTDVKKHLEQKRAEVAVVDLPGRPSHPSAGPQDVSAEKYRDAIVEATGGRQQVILVGHSFGGIQISNVAEAIPNKIHALVYVAAYLPKDGESLQSLSAADKGSHVGASFVVAPDYKTASIKESERVNLFCADCSAAVKARFQLLDEPRPPMAQPAKLTPARFGTVKRYYITTLNDVVISPAKQKEMYTATPVEKVYSIATGHTPFLVKPAELARTLSSIP
jgi:pimeloyl-ACP methyl ester carboxylesterase